MRTGVLRRLSPRAEATGSLAQYAELVTIQFRYLSCSVTRPIVTFRR